MGVHSENIGYIILIAKKDIMVMMNFITLSLLLSKTPEKNIGLMMQHGGRYVDKDDEFIELLQ